MTTQMVNQREPILKFTLPEARERAPKPAGVICIARGGIGGTVRAHNGDRVTEAVLGQTDDHMPFTLDDVK